MVRPHLLSLPLPDLPGRLLQQASSLHDTAQMLRSKRLLLQTSALHDATEILRPERLLLQAIPGHAAAVHVVVHLRSSALRLRERQRFVSFGPLIDRLTQRLLRLPIATARFRSSTHWTRLSNRCSGPKHSLRC